MDKPFYVSGFLYNLKSQQILLLQSNQTDNMAANWSTIGGEGKIGEDAQASFQRVVYELLKLDLKTKNIHPVYDYFHQALDKTNYVFYAIVGKSQAFEPIKDSTLAWVSFHETLKLLFSNQTKQDVTVGERVIHLKERQEEALKTAATPI